MGTMQHAIMTDNQLSPSQQYMIMHSSRPGAAAAAAVSSLTTELLVAAAKAHSSSSNSSCYSASNTTSATTCISTTSTSKQKYQQEQQQQYQGHQQQEHQQQEQRPPLRSSSCVVAPRISTSTMATLEYSVHACPKRLARDLVTVFPQTEDFSNMLIVPTFQKCLHEMVAWDADIAKEKDDRLDDFIRWSKAIHRRLGQLGHWSDMTDPASGYPCYSQRGRDVYPDVDGCQVLLKYDFQNAGCCKILLHPVWGSKIYPATFFTTAPADVLEAVVRQLEFEHRLK